MVLLRRSFLESDEASPPQGQADPGQEPHVFSVTELSEVLRGVLESTFSDIYVEGEISGYKVSQSKHAYFNLKDETALLSCVIWKSSLARIKVPLSDGQMVRVFGHLTLYPPRGNYQMVVQRVQLAGEGLLLKKFEELKRKLEAQGLFASERKRPIPPMPQRIGVITSPTGAAIRDFLRVIGHRFPGLEIDVFPVKVQGIEASGEIAHALQVLSDRGEHDVLVLTRGGGSLEDLWPFNEEGVARAIAACRIPVISAVGHEIDYTIADFVADLRVPTPTAAAMQVVQNREDLLQKLDTALQSLIQYLTRTLDKKRSLLDSLSDKLVHLSPLYQVGIRRQRIDDYLNRMELLVGNCLDKKKALLEQAQRRLLRSTPALIQQRQERLEGLSRRLQLLSPEATLNRGYSLTALESTGRLVCQSSELKAGDRIRTRLRRGQMSSQVIEVYHDDKDK